MGIITGAVRIFSGWGKTYDISTALWKDAWTYICAALDGTWGRQIFSSPNTTDELGTVFNTGYQTHWSTKPFTSTSTTFSLIIPCQSFEIYSVLILNLTDGTISCKKVDAGSSSFSCSLEINKQYQIISTEFLLKTK